MFKWLSRQFSRLFATATSGTYNPASWLIDWVRGGSSSDAGVSVNAVTGLQYPPIWQGVRTYAGDVGMLPLVLYRRQPDGDRQRATTHTSYRRLLRRPNRLMTPIVFKELLTYHAVWHGNGRAYIVRNNRGDVEELIPLLPDRTTCVLVDGEKYHVTEIYEPGTSDPKSRVSGQQFRPMAADHDRIHVLHDRDVLHIVGFGFDGIEGWSLFDHFKNSIGLGLGAEKHTSFTFANKGVPAMVLEAPAGAFQTEEEAKTFLDNFNRFHSGLSNTAKTGLLREGIKANVLALNNADAQLAELRKLQRSDAASLLNLPPHKVGDDSRTSYASLEQENLAYLTHSLMYWLCKWQEECNEKLLTEQQKRADTHYFEFLTSALLRGDILSRYRAYQIGLASEFLSPNEVRAMENLNRREDEGGDMYRNPNTNTHSSDTAKEPADGDAEDIDGVVRNLVVARFAELTEIELARVSAAARREKNFCDWAAKFYDGWEKTIARAIAGMDGDPNMATDYCSDRLAAVLGAAGESTQETLELNVIAATCPKLLAQDLADRMTAAAV